MLHCWFSLLFFFYVYVATSNNVVELFLTLSSVVLMGQCGLGDRTGVNPCKIYHLTLPLTLTLNPYLALKKHSDLQVRENYQDITTLHEKCSCMHMQRKVEAQVAGPHATWESDWGRYSREEKSTAMIHLSSIVLSQTQFSGLQGSTQKVQKVCRCRVQLQVGSWMQLLQSDPGNRPESVESPFIYIVIHSFLPEKYNWAFVGKVL